MSHDLAPPSDVIVFLGPSLPRRAARELLDADYRPPVAQGDVHQAALARPKAIVIIDGYFEAVPAVWHKEILFALSRGIAVFGASSMGALRAAETHVFGMVGIGRVFEAYRDLKLEDDDEVAVIHGPAELGYPPLNEAMVNIRATLDAAAQQSILTNDAAAAVTATAKAIPYRDRDWAAVIAATSALPDADLKRLTDWLPNGRVDQKRLDAEAALKAVAGWLTDGAPPPETRFHFERTSLFARMIEDAPR